MLTEKDYCDYDTCVALKEWGYNRGAYAYYFPNHKEDLIFNTHQMRGCSINEMVKGYNTYPSDVVGHELIDAPTMWEAQKWLREEKGFDIVIKPVDKCTIFIGGERYFSILYRNRERVSSLDVLCTITFEEALLEGIKEAIKLLKEEK